jgi:hypothetical protein
MARVMMNCPETGKHVYTGIDIPRRMFEFIRMPVTTIPLCPECGSDHAIEKGDAYLEVEDSQSSDQGGSSQ